MTTFRATPIFQQRKKDMAEDKDLPSLEELDKKIKKAQHDLDGDPGENKPVVNPTRVSLELFSGVFVGSALGYFIDKWLGTMPIFLIILFFFGVAAGALNIYKLTKNFDEDNK